MLASLALPGPLTACVFKIKHKNSCSEPPPATCVSQPLPARSVSLETQFHPLGTEPLPAGLRVSRGACSKTLHADPGEDAEGGTAAGERRDPGPVQPLAPSAPRRRFGGHVDTEGL